MKEKNTLVGVVEPSALILGVFPFGLALGISASVVSTDYWYTLYPFASLAAFSLLLGIYYLPKVWKLNAVLCENESEGSAAAIYAGRHQMRSIIASAFISGLFCVSFFWHSDFAWMFGFAAGSQFVALTFQVTKLQDYWKTQGEEVTLEQKVA